MTLLTRLGAAAAIAATVAGCGTVQPAENVGPNDPAALAAIKAAYMKAGEQKSFRARMTSVAADGVKRLAEKNERDNDTRSNRERHAE